jgi:CBS domain-containing protein
VEPEETAMTAARRMGARNVGSLVVVDSERRPIGMLTDRDLAIQVVGHGLDPAEVRVMELMSAPPVELSESASVEAVLEVMRERGIRRIVIVGADRALAGVVSLDDVLTHLAEIARNVADVLEKSSPQRLAHEA